MKLITSLISLGILSSTAFIQKPAAAQIESSYSQTCLGPICTTKTKSSDGYERKHSCYYSQLGVHCKTKESSPFVNSSGSRRPLPRGLIYSTDGTEALACPDNPVPVYKTPKKSSEIVGVLNSYSCQAVQNFDEFPEWIELRGGGWIYRASLTK